MPEQIQKSLPPNSYVGIPAYWNLERFGSIAEDAFGGFGCYQVGTSVYSKTFRDVDVRLILGDDEWDAWDFGKPENPNLKWRAMCHAFTELGRAITNLPIDFQIQQFTRANKLYSNRVRHPLIDKSRITEEENGGY